MSNDHSTVPPISTTAGSSTTPPPFFVTCNNLRYAIPYETTSKPIFLKDRFQSVPLHIVLGTMFRRHRGTQPVEEAAEYWKEEIRGGRIEIRRKKQSREDPWEWTLATVSMTDVGVAEGGGTEGVRVGTGIGNGSQRGEPYEGGHSEGDVGHQEETTTLATKGCSIRIRKHVHEKVVPAVTIRVLKETERWVAIDKPAGFSTVDEGGNHGINSLMRLVHERLLLSRGSVPHIDNGNGNGNSNGRSCGPNDVRLTAAHRLDKPVSGVLLIGKSPRKATTLLREIQRAKARNTDATNGSAGNGVEKLYIARVGHYPDSIEAVQAVGRRNSVSPPFQHSHIFPKNQAVVVRAELKWDNHQRRSVLRTTEEMVEYEAHKRATLHGMQRVYDRKRRRRQQIHNPSVPEHHQEPNVDNNAAAEEGPSSSSTTGHEPSRIHVTEFRRLDDSLQPNDGTLLIECRPLTGYRHQIRAHLAVMGWPIANDSAYGGRAEVPSISTGLPTPYVDDGEGTLRKALGSPDVQRKWCGKCRWTMRVLLSSMEGHGDDTTSGSAIEEKSLSLDGGIWLHSHRYVLPAEGIDVVAPLPEWASDGGGIGSKSFG